MNSPKVSIIILNWNGLNDTLECLESVKRSDYPNYEIIVVDNASLNDEPAIIKRKFPEISLIKNNDNLGFAGGNNLGIKRALENGSQYVWLLNNDAVVEPNTLSELIRAGEEHTEIGLISPCINYYSAPDQIQCCGSRLDRDNYRLLLLKEPKDEKALNDTGLVMWGAALLIKRKVIEKIGYLSERFFAYYEDSDYSLRALKNGFINKVAVSAKILHKASTGDIRDNPAHYWFYIVRNEYWFWKENKPAAPYFLFLRKYLAKNLRRIGSLKEKSQYENMDACIDGILCAFRNIGGQWNKTIRAPKAIKKLACWHPYFLADILEGNFRNIFSDIRTRITTKKNRITTN